MAVTQEDVTTQPPTLPQELVLMLLNEETGDFTPGGPAHSKATSPSSPVESGLPQKACVS